MFRPSKMLFFVFVQAAKKAMASPDARSKLSPVIETLRDTIQNLPGPPVHADTNFQIRLLLELSRINIAFDTALQSQGFDRRSSDKIIEDTNWRLASPGVRWLTLVLKLARRTPEQVTRTSNNFLWSYVFREPFKKTDLFEPAKSGSAVAYDVTACPLQTYYRSVDAAHVCQAAACQLDHRMAKEWGVSFKRTQTLAEGASHCDFRFHAK